MNNVDLFFQIFNLSHKSVLLDNIMIFGANYVIILTYLLAVILGFKGSIKERKSLFLIIFSAPMALIIIQVIHLFFKEPRPFIAFPIDALIKHGADNAFPSTHTTMMAVAAFAFGFYKSKWTYLMAILLLWVGFARIFVGVHYPLDIVGGITTGFLAVQLTRVLKSYLFNHLIHIQN